MTRVMITLCQDEREALITLAKQERRDPRQQAALCIRYELTRRGLLPAESQGSEAQDGGQPRQGE